ncbi:hypothetical protein JCM9140_1090 [Halalkalibacter wakoensis JCM 9140]|uniref:Uncharacterized protein n=1 Tax=Halalkalibacter wakoensis JCM 9140 TaxID=1236970 RepID=W4PZF0_9BACI|nr:hypothetical protein [Halalkalibacter wakoensis]GAE25117.1 hypothetical protein JCM9140_1090 [Halalkalibacter wakoensis JCM 9140]
MKNKLNRMKQHMGIEKGKKEKQQQVGLHPSVPFEQEWREFQTTANWFEDQYTS